MKLPLICAECMREDVSTAQFITATDLRDDNCYEVQCPRGHTAYVILQQLKFELLFDIGACALVDGYTREAVSSFTSSLERFFEFFVRAAAIQRKLSFTDIDSAWKEVDRQSERQLGAFIFTHLFELGEMPSLLANSYVKFRNEVIHRGKIPSREEALKYGESVLKVIRAGLHKARKKFPEGIQRLTFDNLQKAHEKATKGAAIVTSCMPTIVSLTNADASHHLKSLEDSLKGLSMWNRVT